LNKLVPTEITLPAEPLSASCGEHHTFVMTQTGIFCWGSNRFGQLGIGAIMNRESMLLVPTQMKFKDGCRQIICGEQHTFALTQNEIWVWGSNNFDQLGLGDSRARNRPEKISKYSDPTGGHEKRGKVKERSKK